MSSIRLAIKGVIQGRHDYTVKLLLLNGASTDGVAVNVKERLYRPTSPIKIAVAHSNLANYFLLMMSQELARLKCGATKTMFMYSYLLLLRF